MLYESKDGIVNVSVTPDVVLQALTEYVNNHIFKEPVKVVNVISYGHPIDQWQLKCVTTLACLAGEGETVH